ncbi:MAG: serine/threonine protein kinase [Myxococcales bacterium]|nr:serine/threonine protein kinase [Myxococcales bacterium]
MTDAAAQTIDREGKYRLGPRLGAGGMAEVFLGWTVGASGFSRAIVIKRVLPEFSQNEQFAAMFVNEAHLASLLHHPNIVAMHLLDRDPDGNLFQILEYVDGRDLEKLCAVGPLPIPVTIYVIASVLRGLGHAHAARNPATGRPLGMVHRDCTPSNVLIDHDGNVKVSDFGVAKAVLATNATQSGTAKGKPGYMSPEQLRGADLDGRSDLFAVGVMTWELLAGYRLFNGETLPAIITQVLEYERGGIQIPAIHTVNPSVPAELSRVVHQLLAPDRTQRPARAEDALALLRPWIPSDGAEQLAQLLAARFPRAPVPEAPASSPATVELHGPRGTPLAVPAPAGTTPTALGQIAAAATGAAPGTAAPRRRGLGLVIAGLGLAVAGIVVGVVLSAGGDAAPRAPASGSGAAGATGRGADGAAGPGGQEASAAATAPVRIDAGAVAPTVAHGAGMSTVGADAATSVPVEASAPPVVDAGAVGGSARPPRATRRDAGHEIIEVHLGGSK